MRHRGVIDRDLAVVMKPISLVIITVPWPVVGNAAVPERRLLDSVCGVADHEGVLSPMVVV